jgi:hypothetical protein
MSSLAYCYLKVDRGASDAHLLEIRTYAQAKDIKIIKLFRGCYMTDFVALDEMLATVHPRNVHAVIVPDMGHLAKDVLEQELLVLDVRRSGANIISLAEANDQAEYRAFVRNVLIQLEAYHSGRQR